MVFRLLNSADAVYFRKRSLISETARLISEALVYSRNRSFIPATKGESHEIHHWID